MVVLIRKTLSKMNNYYILGKHVSPGQHGAGGGQSNAACLAREEIVVNQSIKSLLIVSLHNGVDV